MVRKAWYWIGAGVVLVALVGGALLPTTDQGRRVIRYTQRRLGWGAEGRAVKLSAIRPQAQLEFSQVVKGKPVSYGQVEYPSKKELLTTYRAEAMAWAESSLQKLPADSVEADFLLDLLLSLDREHARTLLRQGLESGRWGYVYGYLGAVRAAFTDAERQDLALTLKGTSRTVLFDTVLQKADQAYLERFLLSQPNQPVSYQVMEKGEGVGAVLAVYDHLGRDAKISIIEALARQRPENRSGLKTWLEREWDPAVRQIILYQMNDTPGLMAAIEKDGFFPQVPLNWQWEREAMATHPDSFLARGIRAYEAVRGAPYFDWDRMGKGLSYWEHGNRYYDPDREIPGWLSYLQTYRKHEGADDAAYRLGRSYEIKGQYMEALRWFHESLTLGDGEMSRHARGRIIWILDALLDRNGVLALNSKELPEEIKTSIQYTLALKQFREGNYSASVQEFDALLEHLEAPTLSAAWWSRDYPFWENVRDQRDQAVRLESLHQVGTPQSRYDMAALMYHDDFLFYNHLWGGGRQGYVSSEALVALDGDMDPAYTRWIAQSNNLLQAITAFEPLQEAPEPIAEKAAYSRAIALLKLVNFGSDISIWQSPNQLAAAGEAALEQFLVAHPKSNLVPDALLSLAFVRGDQTLLERIVKEYPKSGAAETARGQKVFERRPDSRYRMSRIPFRYIQPSEAPSEVVQMVKEAEGKASKQSRTVGEYTYVLVTVGQPGQRIDLSIQDTPDGISVYQSNRSTVVGPGYALVRIPATTRPVIFP